MEKSGPVARLMADKLTQALAPLQLEIEDESYLHAGHSGSRPGGESHFRILIESEAFAGKGRIARQRQVHAILAAELSGPVHALSLKILAPGEAC